MTLDLVLPLADTWGMHGDGDVGWGWMGIWMVLFWGGIVFGAVWLAKRGWSPRESPVTRVTPLEILERRFAEGGISVEEYTARRDVLANGSAAPKDAGRGVGTGST